MNLVIVESPAKGKTIEGYLGKGYKVLASFGHVRDLPKSKIGVDLESFEPEYVIPVKSRKKVTELKKQAQKATKIILATDEDREGEAIAWHLVKALGLDGKGKGAIPKQFERIVFHEITKDAILEAVKNPRQINDCLVDAQQGRRVLDRLVGYNLSPLLWKKIRRGLSAGRVQSVAVKLIVDREREIQAFNPEEYWEIFAQLQASGSKPQEFFAKLAKKNDKPIEITNKEDADKVLAELEGKDFVVEKVEEREQKRNPSAPFITSSLQQEAARKLSFSAKKTMMVAQKLYEGISLGAEGTVGLITYMRTDSLNLSGQAISQARSYIDKNFGKEYLPASPRVFKKKKGAQEAHEAIRPTDLFRTPENVKGYLSPDEFKLYDLIWKRTIASQTKEAILLLTGVDIKAGDYTFRATGNQIKFDGFMKIYIEGRDEEKAEGETTMLPALKKNDECQLIKLDPQQKFTKPPARYSEATLVKALEENGIGRPSTYAPTISTIKDRGYVKVENRYFIPEEVGFIVNDMLVENFPQIVNIDFTAKMEEELDEVAEGCRNWKEPIKEFWIPFFKDIQEKGEQIEKINMDIETDEVCEKCGKPMIIKSGRFGKFLACTGFPDCKNTRAIKTTTGQKCPDCKEGDVVVKKTKRGRTFWGCSRYPDCNWASWQPPKSE